MTSWFWVIKASPNFLMFVVCWLMVCYWVTSLVVRVSRSVWVLVLWSSRTLRWVVLSLMAVVIAVV